MARGRWGKSGGEKAAAPRKTAVEVIDPSGLHVVRSLLSPELLARLSDAALAPEVAKGVCGGLMAAGTPTRIEGANGELHVESTEELELSTKNGVLHGRWLVDCTMPAFSSASSVAKEVVLGPLCDALRNEVSFLGEFECDTMAVSFENKGGRKITREKTLCGWAKDGDVLEPDRRKCWDESGKYIGDHTPVIDVFLGSGGVSWGFKYDKSDAEMLTVDLAPGDVMVRSGEARTWVHACVGIESATGPFDFLQVKLLDHRELQRVHPGIHKRVHGGETIPNKWFQYDFAMVGKRARVTNSQGLKFPASAAKLPDEPATPEKAAPGAARLDRLVLNLEGHLADDSLVKGWEVDKRILKTYKDRAGIRAAAKDCRAKAPKAAAAGDLSRDGLTYVSALEKLYVELSKGKEQDFDAHLADGCEWARKIRGGGAESVPAVLGAVFEMRGGLLQRLHRQRRSGHKGRAIDRDLAKATVYADKCRALWTRMLEAGEQVDSESAATQMQLDYLENLEALCGELEREGEPDFDGMLRNGINFLEKSGAKLCY
jgi:hypothetical protein